MFIFSSQIWGVWGCSARSGGGVGSRSSPEHALDWLTKLVIGLLVSWIRIWLIDFYARFKRNIFSLGFYIYLTYPNSYMEKIALMILLKRNIFPINKYYSTRVFLNERAGNGTELERRGWEWTLTWKR
jgi:hypothetical protein